MNDDPRELLDSAVPPPPTPRHHTAERSSTHLGAIIGAASDVGLRHEVNQDAYRIAVIDADTSAELAPTAMTSAGVSAGAIPSPDFAAPDIATVAVIADGVSSAIDSDIASDHAVAAAVRRVESQLRDDPNSPPQELAEVFAEAFAMANLAVLGSQGVDTQAGSCTLIVGVTSKSAVTVGNIGDSRAYWFGDDGHHVRLSIDDSIAQVRIDMGMSRDHAEQGIHSHAITRWLGPNATDVTPRVLSYTPKAAGWLLLCSDGLWNYASEAAELAPLVRHATTGNDVETAALHLVDWAIAQGGRDNVTVALTRWEPERSPLTEPTPAGVDVNATTLAPLEDGVEEQLSVIDESAPADTTGPAQLQPDGE